MSHFNFATLFEPWLQFHHPIVRQLAFAIASPNILTHIPHDLTIQHSFELHGHDIWQNLYYLYESRLQQLDEYPQPLLDFLARLKSTRLGLRFEHLLWFWLQDDAYHPYQLLGHSLQMIDGAKTLGELDFVLFNQQTQQIEHWEVALKYYLGETQLQLPQWFGLNREDTLQRKLQHFTNRQFQFKQVHQHHIQRRFAVLKGQLYLPSRMLSQLPTWINTARRLGHWGHHIPKQEYYRLQRHEWICPNQQPSSNPATWWTNGLYSTITAEPQFYMFRQPPLCLSNLSERNNT